MTIKQALDIWWNSIRVRMPKGVEPHKFIIYKCSNGEYNLDDMEDVLEINEEDLLKCTITLDDNYDNDSDGYPIAFAELNF